MARSYRRKLARVAFALALFFTLSIPAAAQPQGRPEQIPPIDERTKDLKKIDGFFPLYWNEAAGRLWMEIPKLDVEVLYSTGLASDRLPDRDVRARGAANHDGAAELPVPRAQRQRGGSAHRP